MKYTVLDNVTYLKRRGMDFTKHNSNKYDERHSFKIDIVSK
jgi:hypothetical protein